LDNKLVINAENDETQRVKHDCDSQLLFTEAAPVFEQWET